METQGSESDSVLERLQKLEKRNRQLGWAVLVLLLLVVASAGNSWAVMEEGAVASGGTRSATIKAGRG